MREADIMRAVQAAASDLGARLFRNNVGTGWVGTVVRRTATTITLANPRPLHSGLCVGSSDLIGWTPIPSREATAIFTAVEVKTRRGRVSDEQKRFLDKVSLDGGIGIVARSVDEAIDGIRSAIQKRNG